MVIKVTTQNSFAQIKDEILSSLTLASIVNIKHCAPGTNMINIEIFKNFTQLLSRLYYVRQSKMYSVAGQAFKLIQEFILTVHIKKLPTLF